MSDTKRNVLKKDIILSLLAQADIKWYIRSDQVGYRRHLEFVAEYIALNYNKEAKKEAKK